MAPKTLERSCLHCSKPFTPDTGRQLYHDDLCRRAAGRIRDRERHAGIASGGSGASPGACRQCHQQKALRFDSYGSVTGLDAEACFCSADCVISWWQDQATAVTPDDLDPGLSYLLDPGRFRPDEADDLDEDGWLLDDYED